MRYLPDADRFFIDNGEYVREFGRLLAAGRYVEAAKHAADATVVITPSEDVPDDPSQELMAWIFDHARNPWVDRAMAQALHHDLEQANRIVLHRRSHLLVSRYLLKALDRANQARRALDVACHA